MSLQYRSALHAALRQTKARAPGALRRAASPCLREISCRYRLFDVMNISLAINANLLKCLAARIVAASWPRRPNVEAWR